MTFSRMISSFPSARPKLPRAEAIMPYLREIDSRRQYSNFGPLVRCFEAELSAHFEAEPGSVITIANATTGITLALQEAVGGSAGLCMMPAWTFVATPLAAVNAGLTPFFVNVDLPTWQLTPEHARDALERAPGKVCAVVPVAPFGAEVDVAAWGNFSDETGVPVVIDAAAGFDTAHAYPGLISVVSLHATKTLGIGEGGFILSGTAERGERLRRMSNFGKNAAGESVLAGGNAKLNEYSAAVGLAALGEWPVTRAALVERAAAFCACLGDIEDVIVAPTGLGKVASSTFNVILREPIADDVVDWMQRSGMETRKWWPQACHQHAMFAGFPREDLLQTEELVRHVIALPFWMDMSDDEQSSVAKCLRLAYAASRP